MHNLAIIPARSGSKGIKDKNIRSLNGKPLLAYSIEAARRSGLFDTVFVSTDSEQYAQISREYGATVPFLRSAQNSSDTASSWNVVSEVLHTYQKMGQVFDTFTLLQPTSPLRTGDDIQKAYELFRKKDANVVVSVCETDHSPLWANTLDESLSLNHFFSPDLINLPRQQLPTYYRINGALYLVSIPFFLQDKNLYGEKSFAYIMPKEKSIDIDTEMDFFLAEYYLHLKEGAL